MRILFYLPVVTPWWFANIVAPLIRAATRGAEVHVLVPPLWQGTGLGDPEIDLALTIEGVAWHPLDGPGHPALRTDASGDSGLAEFVQALAPDLTLCRSADIRTPAGFPGTVRYIMEGGTPPFALPPHWVILSETLFDHGFAPALSQAEAASLRASVAPAWHAARASALRQPRDAVMASLNLPADRRILSVPLEYEHPEMFFGQHHLPPNNIALLTHIAARVPDDVVIAATNHPLNELHCDNAPLHAAVAAVSDRVRLVAGHGVTALLAAHADAMVVGNSKSWAAAAAHGTPVCRLSSFHTAPWVNAYCSVEALFADPKPRAADPDDALTWAAATLAGALIDPTDPRLNAAALADHACNPVGRERRAAGLARFLAIPDRLAA